MRWSIQKDDDNDYTLLLDGIKVEIDEVAYYSSIQELVEALRNADEEQVRPAYGNVHVISGKSIQELYDIQHTHPELFI